MELADPAVCDRPTSLENRYQYQQLIAEDAVRVLNLYPANDFQSPLRGFMRHHRLETESIDPDGCNYSAVSYAWGDATFSRQILVRVGTEWSLLPITRNADLLLRYLRDAHKETQFWIDSVCINQDDQEEKVEQIPLMGQIYSYAKRVHVWLGDDEIEDAQRAFSLIRHIEQIEQQRASQRSYYYPNNAERLCLERFFNRPWFTRRWVIQEVFFAHDAIFHSGYHRLSYSRVRAGLKMLEQLPSKEPLGYGVNMLGSIGAGLQESRGLLGLLWGLHESDCSDKRDRIAALYALIPASERPPLLYDAGWKKLYTEIASLYLNSAYGIAHVVLHHLCGFGSIESRKESEVPSWVPNWATRRRKQVSFHAWQSPLCREYPLFFPQIKVPFHLTRSGAISVPDEASRSEHWRQAEDRYEEYLGGSGNPHGVLMTLRVTGNRLRIKYDFLTFIYGCGNVVHHVCPSSSGQFWEDIVGLFQGQERYMTRSRVASKEPRDKRQQLEAISLSALFIGILLGTSPPMEDYHQSAVSHHISKLCANVVSGHTYMGEVGAPIDRQREYLHKIGSALTGSALLRVQTIAGYYWAIGQVTSVKGDWWVPIIPDGMERFSNARYVTPKTTRFLCLRPFGTGAHAKAWYSSPTTDLERRLRRLVSFMKTGVDPAPIAVKCVGSGECSKYAFDHSLSYYTALWDIFMQAADTAKGRSRPLSVSFDIF